MGQCQWSRAFVEKGQGMRFVKLLLIVVSIMFSGLLAGCSPQRPAAIIELERRAESGDRDAAYDLAEKYDAGRGVKYDSKAAFRNYLRAAERGHAEAQFKLANRYDNGVGTEKDTLEGMTWYLIAQRNPALSSRSRRWADIYVRSFFSVRAMQSGDSLRLMQDAERRAITWKPRSD